MIKCCDCGAVFEESEIVVESDDPSPAGVALSSGSYKYYHCPKCMSEDIERATECKACGEWVTLDEGVILCESCQEDLMESLEEIRNGMKLTKDDFKDAIAEVFGWL